MISFGNAASSHSGLIPLKTAYKKRGELLWAIASKKDFINLHSDAFDAVLEVIWSMPKNLAFFQKRSINFFINSTIPRSIVKKYSVQVLRTLKTGKAFKQGLKYGQCSPQICVYKRASSLFTGIVFKFHIHVHIQQKDRICIKKDPQLNLRDMLISG